MAAISHPLGAWHKHPATCSAVVIVLCIALAWGGVLCGSFQYDDYPNILTDPVMHDSGRLWQRLLTGVRPLTRLSYVLDQWLWGDTAGGWLLTNLLLHTATALGLWRLLYLSHASAFAAVVGALAFALQPAHGMTVSYVSGRSTGLMCALLVASMLLSQAYLHHARRRHLVGALLCFALAVAAKEIALIFPLLWALWLHASQTTQTTQTTPSRPAAPRKLLWGYIAVAIACLAVAACSTRYQSLLAYSLHLRSPWESVVRNAAALPATASLLLRPWALAVEQPSVFQGYHSALGACGLLLWITVALRCWRKRPWVSLAMLWPLIALLPSHSLVAKLDAVSESNLYWVWLGPSMALAAGVPPLLRKALESFAMPIVLFILVVAAALGCAWRTWVWGDSVRLWHEATLRAPSARTWNNLGMAHLNHDQPALARQAFATALQYQPMYAPAVRNLEMLDLLSQSRE
jgi:protein O-mannosyl-transferase